MVSGKIRVLIVDDSAVVRQSLSDVLSRDPQIEVIGTAGDPFAAAEKIREHVITLDIEMPRMDGLTFLEQIMTQHPIPVIICSSLAEEGAESTLRALELGAVDVIVKPRFGTKQFLEDSRIVLCEAVKAAASVRLQALRPNRTVQPKLTADAMLPAARRSRLCSKLSLRTHQGLPSCSTCRSCLPGHSPTGWMVCAGSR
jgi:two-component system chemotaxis response regulator CheB